MPTASQEEALNAFVSQPVNNLIVFVAIMALVVVLLIGFAVWKSAPALINLFKQQADTNEKLTQIVGQNSTQARLAVESVDRNTSEMMRQTASIEAQTVVIEGQGRDLRNYQVLVSDNLSAHTKEITENTATVAALKESIEQLSSQIREMLESKAAQDGAEAIIQTLRDEILAFISEQQAKPPTAPAE